MTIDGCSRLRAHGPSKIAFGFPIIDRSIRAVVDDDAYGKEKKSLGYVIAIMNMILHGIEAPNIIHTNTLSENLADIQDKNRYDVVLANPPFGGKERKDFSKTFRSAAARTRFSGQRAHHFKVNFAFETIATGWRASPRPFLRFSRRTKATQLNS